MAERSSDPRIVVSVRLSPSEKQHAKTAAEINLQTLSEFTRDAVVTAASECLEDQEQEASMSQEQCLDLPRRRGRPRQVVPRNTVSTWIPADQHDRLIRAANRREMSVSELVRGVIARWMAEGTKR